MMSAPGPQDPKPKTLFVDDDSRVLAAISRLLRRKLDIMPCNDQGTALGLLRANPDIDVVVSDQAMPGMCGTEFLARAAQIRPAAQRIMLTGDQHNSTMLEAINKGKVFRFLSKPSSPDELYSAICEGTQWSRQLRREQALLEETLAGSVRMMVDLLTLTEPRRAALSRQISILAKQIGHAVEVDDLWELEIAGLLCQMGQIVLQVDTPREQDGDGGPQTDIAPGQSAAISRQLVGNIPRLQHVAHIIGLHKRGYDGSGYPEDGPTGKDIPVHARILNIVTDMLDIADDDAQPGESTFAELRQHSARYDPDLLDFIEALYLNGRSAFHHNWIRQELDLFRLLVGDRLATDLVADNGRLLLAGGSVVSQAFLERIRQAHKAGHISGKVSVLREQLQ